MIKKNRYFLGIVLAIGVGIFIWEFRKLSFTEVWRELQQLNWGWILVAFLSMLVYWGFKAKIIQSLLRRRYKSYKFSNAYRVSLIEDFFNAITPFSTGGQPAQLVALNKTGVDIGVGSSVLLMKFVVYQGMIVVVFGICVLFGYQALSSQISQLAGLIIFGLLIHIVVIIVLLLITFKANWLKSIIHWILKGLKRFKDQETIARWEEGLVEKIDAFYEESVYIRNEKKLLLEISLLTLIQLFFYFIVPYFILLSLGVSHISILTIISLHAFIVLIVSMFPIPGGAGGAEYSFTLLFGGFIANQEKLVIALILWRIFTYYLGIFLGAFALKFKKSEPLEKD